MQGMHSTVAHVFPKLLTTLAPRTRHHPALPLPLQADTLLWPPLSPHAYSRPIPPLLTAHTYVRPNSYPFPLSLPGCCLIPLPPNLPPQPHSPPLFPPYTPILSPHRPSSAPTTPTPAASPDCPCFKPFSHPPPFPHPSSPIISSALAITPAPSHPHPDPLRHAQGRSASAR